MSRNYVRSTIFIHQASYTDMLGSGGDQVNDFRRLRKTKGCILIALVVLQIPVRTPARERTQGRSEVCESIGLGLNPTLAAYQLCECSLVICVLLPWSLKQAWQHRGFMDLSERTAGSVSTKSSTVSSENCSLALLPENTQWMHFSSQHLPGETISGLIVWFILLVR